MTQTDDQLPVEEPTEVMESQEPEDTQTAEIEAWKSKYLRALADYQNLEKRTTLRRHEDSRMAARQVIAKLLPVIDVIYKAHEALQDKGLSLAIKQIEDVLKSEHVEKVDVLGKAFDPETMECIELTDGEGHDTVVEETQAGYRLHDIVIRPAQVKVGKKKK